MNERVDLRYQEWGKGPPVLALHGLGVESSMFTGLARGVGDLGLRMLAADLPGFGRTPAPDAPLTPPVLAEPVLDLARCLESKVLVMGLSLGARVALEAALLEPDLFRGVVMAAPPLPRRTHLWTHFFARLLLNPTLAEKIPLELAWPWLKALADRWEKELSGGGAEHDWLARSAKRAIYYFSCPATRRAFVSAARGLALDPPFGPEGVWTRLPQLKVPAAFVWGGRDQFLDKTSIPLVAELLPGAFQIHVPCAGHYDNGPHFRCMEQGSLEGVRLVEASAAGQLAETAERQRCVECIADVDQRGTAAA
jgi:pimeloyl-ACP methyl ester carboxylesterase